MAKPRTSAKSGFALPATRVKAANAWREWSNPVAGLTVARAVELATSYTRGDYADLMYLMAAPATGVESRDALLGTLMGRRESALESLDWKIRTVNPDTAGFDAKLAADQEAALRATYEKFEGLQDLIRHLAAAPFRGFAAAEILRDWSGLPASFTLVAPWNIARDGLAGDWYYNPEARQGSARALGDALRIRPEDWVIATDPRPIHGVSLLRFVRENLTERDWASFCEIYGIPGGVVIGPANVPEDKEADYEAAADAIARGGSGYLPNGSDYKANGYPGANSPFKEWMEHLERRLVLRSTGGLLSVLAANTGVGGGGQGAAHADAFAQIALADARRLSDLLNRAVDRAVLDHHFAGRPRFAYWSLLPDEQPDTAAIVDHALKLSQAGYAMEVAELSERTGYALATKPGAPSPSVASAVPAREVANAEPGDRSAIPNPQSAIFLDAVAAQAAPVLELLDKLPDPSADPQAYASALAELRERLPELLDPAPLSAALESAMLKASKTPSND